MVQSFIIHFFVYLLIILISPLAERNLNPKAACLKRREEEKAEDGPKIPQHHMLPQGYANIAVSGGGGGGGGGGSGGGSGGGGGEFLF